MRSVLVCLELFLQMFTAVETAGLGGEWVMEVYIVRHAVLT